MPSTLHPSDSAMPSPSLTAGHNTMFEPSAPPEPPWTRQKLRVPREDQTLFARPELGVAAELARGNQSLLEECDVELSRRSLQRLRVWSREEVVRAARKYTSGLIGQPLAEDSIGLLLAGGHQPSLFHPGVWVKNFAIGALAERTGGTALHLIVDNDTLSTTRIRVPAGSRERPQIETVPFDDDRPTQPWEDAQIINRPLFDSTGDRLLEHMAVWKSEPLIGEMWPAAVEEASRSTSLRDALTAARHLQERRWGLTNLELPLSRLCELDPFLWFASHIFAQLPRFRDVHNQVLNEFRRVNRIRSRTHPVPPLSEERSGWLEAPFWFWRTGEHHRRRVFAKQVGREIHLSGDEETFARLPLTPDGEACCAVEVLRTLSENGMRLRTRALTTTLFARLCLADLFVHGIGGSKYDEMTDRIISRFFHLRPPSFLTLSATLHLPLAEPFDVTPNDVRHLQGLLRDLRYNSDRHLAPGNNEQADALIAEKRRLIAEEQRSSAEPQPRSERRLHRRERHERYLRLREIGQQLAELTISQKQRIEADLAVTEQQLAANTVLKNREFSFCLYPAEKLRSFLTDLPFD